MKIQTNNWFPFVSELCEPSFSLFLHRAIEAVNIEIVRKLFRFLDTFSCNAHCNGSAMSYRV